MADTKADYYVMMGVKACPRAEDHDPEVEWGIDADLTFSQWAREKSKTHRPVKCDGCGLFKCWEPRPASWGTAA